MGFGHKFVLGITFSLVGVMASACGGGTKSVETGSVMIEAENTGPWKLTRDESGISFVTIKKGSIAEIGTFAAIDGKVSEDGAAEFTIVLDSVFTNNETRDPRMRQYLFETDKHPYLTAKANIDLAGLTNLPTGKGRSVLLDLTVDLHGVSEQKEAWVVVTRLGPNKVSVANKAPLLIEASDYGLEAGVDKLRELASLESITPVVPVTFSLVFER